MIHEKGLAPTRPLGEGRGDKTPKKNAPTVPKTTQDRLAGELPPRVEKREGKRKREEERRDKKEEEEDEEEEEKREDGEAKREERREKTAERRDKKEEKERDEGTKKAIIGRSWVDF